MSDGRVADDFLHRARRVASGLLVLAGLLAIVGSFLPWVSISPPAVLPAEEAANAQAFTGVEARDGWWVVGSGGILTLLALGVVARGRSLYGWLAFLVSVVVGSIVIADYRGLNEITSAISRRMNIVGDATAGAGLVIVGIAALIGVIGALVAVAAAFKPDVVEG
jgi:hypothetical protein